ncbi:lactoylglutathione lyase [Bacillus sp. DX4.1]|uniref:VOC family protein n=1 Tax=Bacillus sp. DX4.1 TaxID=3055867 RepID=UPI0025A2FE51|nr:VOC family protein [Bacillus sp. DX4.1]MDM5187244.1 lactoylglutathione lyase [Bacillus sp. DX4.1]
MDNIKNSIVLEVRNLKETLYFYEGVLGLEPSRKRPQLDVPGVWYDIGSIRICFIVNKKRRDVSDETLSTQIELNLPFCDLEKVQKKLEFYRVAYKEIADDHEEKKSIIVYDPDQYRLQIDSSVRRKESS